MESFHNIRKNIISTDVLIIDEISMISGKIFDSVELICRTVRGSECVFGGLQVVVGGDFLFMKENSYLCFESC